MSIFDRMKRGRDRTLPANATFMLTQQGTAKSAEFSGDPRSRVLEALVTGGTSDVQEIANTSGLNRGKTERTIRQLINGGYVQMVNASMSEAE